MVCTARSASWPDTRAGTLTGSELTVHVIIAVWKQLGVSYWNLTTASGRLLALRLQL